MKETIYTIPINESFEISNGECPVCRLHTKLNTDTIEYVLGAAMMEPLVRIQTNKQGFCPSHLAELIVQQKRLPLSLLLETHIKEIAQNPELFFGPEQTCYCCNRINGYLQSYYNNIIYLWETDPAFRDKFAAQTFYCRTHLSALYNNVSKKTGKKLGLYACLEQKAKTICEEELSTLSVFIKTFDHRFSGQDIGDAKQAIEQAQKFLSGRVE